MRSQRDHALYLVTRSAPRTDRPRLHPDREERLYDLERRNAHCYAGLEDLAYRFERLAEQIRDDGAVETVVEENDSLVHHIEAAKTVP